jgi:hypothetical protein
VTGAAGAAAGPAGDGWTQAPRAKRAAKAAARAEAEQKAKEAKEAAEEVARIAKEQAAAAAVVAAGAADEAYGSGKKGEALATHVSGMATKPTAAALAAVVLSKLEDGTSLKWCSLAEYGAALKAVAADDAKGQAALLHAVRTGVARRGQHPHGSSGCDLHHAVRESACGCLLAHPR